MRWRGVEVEVILLDVLAVVALVAGDAEQPLLEDRVALVPEGQAQADVLKPVAEARQAVLVPAVGPAAGVVVGEVGPGVSRARCSLPARFPRPARPRKAPSPFQSARRARLSARRWCSAVGGFITFLFRDNPQFRENPMHHGTNARPIVGCNKTFHNRQREITQGRINTNGATFHSQASLAYAEITSMKTLAPDLIRSSRLVLLSFLTPG